MDNCHLLYNSFLHFNLLQTLVYYKGTLCVHMYVYYQTQFNLMLLFLKCVFQSTHEGKSKAVYICGGEIIPELLQCTWLVFDVMSLCCVCVRACVRASVYFQSIRLDEPLFFIFLNSLFDT